MKTGVYIIKNYLYHPLGENYKLFCGGGGNDKFEIKRQVFSSVLIHVTQKLIDFPLKIIYFLKSEKVLRSVQTFLTSGGKY